MTWRWKAPVTSSKQQRVPGRGGVDHDVLGAAEAEEPAERAEHGDLGGARRAQILDSQSRCSASSRAAQLLGGVARGLGVADRCG